MSYPVIRLHEIQGALGRRNRLDFGTVWPRVQIPGPDQIRIQSHPAGGFNVTSPLYYCSNFAVNVATTYRLQSYSVLELARGIGGIPTSIAGPSRKSLSAAPRLRQVLSNLAERSRCGCCRQSTNW